MRRSFRQKRINIDKLVEAILLQAEILDLKADPTCKASGTVIEAKMEKAAVRLPLCWYRKAP